MLLFSHQLEGGTAMKFFFVATILLAPFQAFAQVPGTPVPEPLSVGLLAIGLGGVGAAEFIRRRKNK